MSREIDYSRPLSDADREYLHARGEHARVEQMDQRFDSEPVTSDPLGDGDDDTLPPYEEWTLAELQEELGNRKLQKTGNKTELVARLRADDSK